MTREFSAGNYRFIPSVFQYSAGAAADDGYEIERVRFDRLVPLAEGFALAAKYIQEAGRPLTAWLVRWSATSRAPTRSREREVSLPAWAAERAAATECRCRRR